MSMTQNLRARLTGLGRPLSVAVASGKGGVGKSIISLSLAVEHSSHGVRTLLIDGDIGLGNQHLLANVTPMFTIEDVLAGSCRVEEASLKLNENLTLIPARSGFSDTEVDVSLSTDDVRTLLSWMKNHFDLILVDTAAGISPRVTQIAGLTDMVLMVTTPDIAAVADSYAVTKYLVKTNASTRVAFVINRVTKDREGRQTAQNLNRMTRKFLRLALPDVPIIREHMGLKHILLSRNILVPGFEDRDWSRGIRDAVSAICDTMPDDLSHWTQGYWEAVGGTETLNSHTINVDRNNEALIQGGSASRFDRQEVTAGKDSL